MAGLVGTAAMFSEACGLGIAIEREAVERPPGVDELRWLSCFPSFGFLLAVPPERLSDLPRLLGPCGDLISGRIGSFSERQSGVWLVDDHDQRLVWDAAAPLTGFHAARAPGRPCPRQPEPPAPMPEVVLQLCWPDGEASRFYSPSTVVYKFLQPGDTLSVAELEKKGLAALREASERVRARYGFACTRTDEEALKLRQSIARYSASDEVKIRALDD